MCFQYLPIDQLKGPVWASGPWLEEANTFSPKDCLFVSPSLAKFEQTVCIVRLIFLRKTFIVKFSICLVFHPNEKRNKTN